MLTPSTASLVPSRKEGDISNGTSEPSAELMPMTRLFATETPSRSTLNPKQIAPKPHKNPKPNAARRAPNGACPNTVAQFGAVALTTTAGMMRQDTTINTIQMFSHFQRCMIFMGAVNNPLQMPDEIASAMP